jgi:hypothetical protein
MYLCIFDFQIYSMTSKKLFCVSERLVSDVLIEVVKVGSKVRFVTITNQKVPAGLFISCSYRERRKFPIGSVLKVDCRLINPSDRKPFLRHTNNQPLSQYRLFTNLLVYTPVNQI